MKEKIEKYLELHAEFKQIAYDNVNARYDYIESEIKRLGLTKWPNLQNFHYKDKKLSDLDFNVYDENNTRYFEIGREFYDDRDETYYHYAVLSIDEIVNKTFDKNEVDLVLNNELKKLEDKRLKEEELGQKRKQAEYQEYLRLKQIYDETEKKK